MTNQPLPMILVADDEADIRGLLRILLEKEGYRVLEAVDGLDALRLVKTHGSELSLIILDIMMPNVDGLAAAKAIRDFTDVPILFLTARSSDGDKTEAYRLGADDYITKPFLTIDLKLKVHAMIRRYDLNQAHFALQDKSKAEGSGSVTFGDVEWRPEELAVYRLGERVQLTDREYELFARLCRSRGESVSPSKLYEDVWEETYLASSSNTVIVHIANLRRKLEKDPSSPTLIRTVWGKGYRID